MDPDICFENLLYNLANGNQDEAVENARDLQAWLARGGFAPWDEKLSRPTLDAFLQWVIEQQQEESSRVAFDAARALINQGRATEILSWQNWRNGGVLGGAPRPTCPDMVEAEEKAIRRLWLTLDDSSCWMTALYMLYNDHRPLA